MATARKGLGVIFFIAFIILLSSSFVYIFFGNQGQIDLSIKGRDQMLNELSVLNDDLKRGRMIERDSVIKLHSLIVNKDSNIFVLDSKLKKETLAKIQLIKKVDSLANILKNVKLSDIQPVK